MDRTVAPKVLAASDHASPAAALRCGRSRPAAERVAAVEFLEGDVEP